MPAATFTHTQAGLASALRIAVMRLARRLRNEREDVSLTLTQLSTLGTLARLGPLPLGELAAAERVQPPSMTRIVSGLEERGLAVREADPKDRRLVIVRLADEGKALLAADRRRRDAWLNHRLRELSPDERAVLRQAVPVLEKLASL
ncbi:MAG TPA: MarR family transcriptional regulator [Jiangellaceae bacterium]|nr:MarR family transcriptional regulator [Jiangellaceae bacterium]